MIPVELWSTAPSAVESTSATFRQMGCVGIVENAGLFFIDTGTADEGFILFAAERQGYVKRIIPAAPVSPERKGTP